MIGLARPLDFIVTAPPFPAEAGPTKAARSSSGTGFSRESFKCHTAEQLTSRRSECRSALARESVGTDDPNASDVPASSRASALLHRSAADSERSWHPLASSRLKPVPLTPRSPSGTGFSRESFKCHTAEQLTSRRSECRSALARESVGTDDPNASDVPASSRASALLHRSAADSKRSWHPLASSRLSRSH